MSLDFYLTEVVTEEKEQFSANITHNLTEMASKAGIYDCLWRPEENGYKKAKDIIRILEKGIEDMRSRPDYYKQFDSCNGWGKYDDFVPWLEKVLEACMEYQESKIETSV